MDEDIRDQPGFISRIFSSIELKYQYYLDRLTPYTTIRWTLAVFFILSFLARVFVVQNSRPTSPEVGRDCRTSFLWENYTVLKPKADVNSTIKPELPEGECTFSGFYIVTYAVGIYYLNLFLLFLTPSIDPALEFDDDDDGPVLPSKTTDEFRPFMRRLPEFKFWYSTVKATLVAWICTFFEMFDVPVFWPILVMYFIILFCLTMKRQIMHMIKYKYIPFTVGKPRRAGKEDTGKVVVG